jgi:NADPH-dependent 2,4-dienoyl-CoA reductase/sulfur reductase-like enzyme
MQTNRQNLYAAGDASQGYNHLSGQHDWLGTWGSACCQGRVAGCNMTGKEAAYPGSIPQNISSFFDWTYAQLGDVQPHKNDDRCIVIGDPGKASHFVLTFDGDILAGASLINCTHLAGKVRQAIVRKWHWEKYLRQPDRYFTTGIIEKILNEITDIGCQSVTPALRYHEQVSYSPYVRTVN